MPTRLRERVAGHVGLLLIVLASIGGASLYLGTRVMNALPDVGKNLNPPDSWGAPIAVERRADGWLVGHIPPCAQGPVAGLFLWDDHNRPFWEVRGEAFPIEQFVIGGTPPGLKVVHKLDEPSRNQVLRLGVFRGTGRPAGVTFRIRDLRVGKVHYGSRWVTVDEFKFMAKCPKPKVEKTSTPITLPARTVPPPPTTFPPTSAP